MRKKFLPEKVEDQDDTLDDDTLEVSMWIVALCEVVSTVVDMKVSFGDAVQELSAFSRENFVRGNENSVLLEQCAEKVEDALDSIEWRYD